MNKPCEHKRKGHTRGYLTIFCKSCRAILEYDWDTAKWYATNRKYPNFWQRLFGKRPH